MFRKLKRVWSHNDMDYIPRFREVFPELNKLTSEEMCERWITLGIDFYTEEKTRVNKYIRLTLPFAIVLMLLMLLGLPLVFIITGRWSYPLGDKNFVLNWFRRLKLL